MVPSFLPVPSLPAIMAASDASHAPGRCFGRAQEVWFPCAPCQRRGCHWPVRGVEYGYKYCCEVCERQEGKHGFGCVASLFFRVNRLESVPSKAAPARRESFQVGAESGTGSSGSESWPSTESSAPVAPVVPVGSADARSTSTSVAVDVSDAAKPRHSFNDVNRHATVVGNAFNAQQCQICQCVGGGCVLDGAVEVPNSARTRSRSGRVRRRALTVQESRQQEAQDNPAGFANWIDEVKKELREKYPPKKDSIFDTQASSSATATTGAGGTGTATAATGTSAWHWSLGYVPATPAGPAPWGNACRNALTFADAESDGDAIANAGIPLEFSATGILPFGTPFRRCIRADCTYEAHPSKDDSILVWR